MARERRYSLKSEDANQQINTLLEHLKVAPAEQRHLAEMLTTVLKLHEDGAGAADVRLANAALKEMRYGFKVFAPYRHVPKVTVFGSARTQRDHPVSEQAFRFGRRMAEAGWMVITGAGSGVMGAAQEGAGRERSFGLNIRLPQEQAANEWILDDPKLITFKYFFTRKLFLVREAFAMAFFPGGFGTADEAFEALTLVQTGKAPMLPLVMVDAPGGGYWKAVSSLIQAELAERAMVSADDVDLFRVTDDVDMALAEIENFYRVFHSQRFVGDHLVFRLRRALSAEALAEVSARFDDILEGPAEQVSGPLPAERGELPDMPRLMLPFDRKGFGRLRKLVDFVNAQ